MEQLNNYLETRELAVNTIKTYRNNFLTILKLLNLPSTVPNLDWICNTDVNIDTIMATDRTLYIKKSLISLLSGLSSATFGDNSLPHMDYKNELTRINVTLNDLKMDQDKTVNQTDNWINYPDLLELINTYPFDNLDDGTLKKSLLTFLVNLPRRLGELAIMKFIYRPSTKLIIDDLSNEFNYLVLEDDIKKCRLIFNNFKTIKTHGIQTMTLPSSIYVSLMEYVTNREDFKPGILLPLYQVPGKTEAYPGNSLTNVVSRTMLKISGKKVNPHLFRHIYITHYLGSKNISMNDKDRIAKRLAVSLQEAQLSYQKME